jgi:hypothetical protein
MGFRFRCHESYAFYGLWFGSGLSESRTEGRSPATLIDHRLYRKAPLFNRFLKFNVQVEGSDISH